MGKIASATTVYATAYLTEKGRQYLFNQSNIRFDSSGNDLFKIETFTLSDADNNYKTTFTLESGDVPDVTGKSEGCLKATSDIKQIILTYFTVSATSFINPLYISSTQTGNIITQSSELLLDVDSSGEFPVSTATDVPPTVTSTSTTTTTTVNL